MFGLVKEIFIILWSAFTIRFGESLNSNSDGCIKCVSLNNPPCQARPTLVDRNSNEALSYPFIVNINKCGGSCNTIDDPDNWVCLSNKVKNMNIK